MRVIKQQHKQNYFETKETDYNAKNKKIRKYSKPNLYECRGNKTTA